MRALNIRPGGLDALAIVEIDEPREPSVGEIRVRIHASSLNYKDLFLASGRRPLPEGRVPLADAAGAVDAVGPDVTEFAVGDSVVSCFFPDWKDGPEPAEGPGRNPGDNVDGYARDLVARPASWFTKAPKNFSHLETAALTTAGVTAWRVLIENGRLKAGDVVVALGTGGVSIFALQIAKAMGARVVITSSSDEKLARAQALGADLGINYKRTPEWSREVLAFTGGRGADHIIEVGGPPTMAQSAEACRQGGHIALVGFLAGMGGEMPAGTLLRRQQRLQGLMVGSRRVQQDFIRALDTLSIKPVIDTIFPIEETVAALKQLQAGRHFSKIGLTF